MKISAFISVLYGNGRQHLRYIITMHTHNIELGCWRQLEILH